MTLLWSALLLTAVAWPSRALGVFDGLPLSGRAEAIAIGALVPALLWFDAPFVRTRRARAAIVALFAVKLASMLLPQQGLCARFMTAAPLSGRVLTMQIDEPKGFLRSWDVRADWRAAEPRCTAILDRSYAAAGDFPAWFVNLLDVLRPGRADLTLYVDGYVNTTEAGTFSIGTGPSMAVAGTIAGRQVSASEGRNIDLATEPGDHAVHLQIAMHGDDWALQPAWANRGDAWNELTITTSPAGPAARAGLFIVGLATSLLVVALLLMWLGDAAAHAGVERPVALWMIASVAAAAICAAIPAAQRFSGVVLLAAPLVPVATRHRTIRTAFLMIGLPWLTFFVVRSFGEIGRMVPYSVDDWLAYQAAGYRIFMNGFWLEGGTRTFDYQALYRWIGGALHLVFGDSSIGETYLDAALLLTGALLSFALVKPRYGFRAALFAGSATLATFTLGTTWYFVGRGLAEIAASGCVFITVFCLLRARLGRMDWAIAAGAMATLMFYARQNHLALAPFLAAFALPLAVTSSVRDMVGRLASVRWRVVATYFAVCAAGVAAFVLRTWWYAGALSLFYGTSLRNNDTGLRATTLLSPEVWRRVAHSLLALVWMNEPPHPDPRALFVVGGVAVAVAAFAQAPKLRALPFGVTAAVVGSLVSPLFVHTHNYPGRMTIHLVPFAAAAFAIAGALLLPRSAWARLPRAVRRDPAVPAASPDPLLRRRRVVFATAAIALAGVSSALALLAVDMYLHGKYQTSAGVNVWGYRGPVASKKQPGEYRVVVLGGSSAFGYGVSWDQAIPAMLERSLRSRGGRPFSVINLAYNNEGAYSMKFTLQDYAYLDYDLACLYEGYNDLMADPNKPNLSVFRHDSPIFRLTGYLPIFPIIFREKAAMLLYGGNVTAAYRDSGKTVFSASVAQRAAAGVLDATAAAGESLERQLDRVAREPARAIAGASDTGCREPWEQYCRSILDAATFALARDKQVLVITQPYVAGMARRRHQDQQEQLASMVARTWDASRVRYVNLGNVVDVSDPLLSFDRMHLTERGNERIASMLVEPVLQMAALHTAHD